MRAEIITYNKHAIKKKVSKAVVGSVMAPKEKISRSPSLQPVHVTLYGKMDFVDVTKLRIWGMADYLYLHASRP